MGVAQQIKHFFNSRSQVEIVIMLHTKRVNSRCLVFPYLLHTPAFSASDVKNIEVTDMGDNKIEVLKSNGRQEQFHWLRETLCTLMRYNSVVIPYR